MYDLSSKSMYLDDAYLRCQHSDSAVNGVGTGGYILVTYVQTSERLTRNVYAHLPFMELCSIMSYALKRYALWGPCHSTGAVGRRGLSARIVPTYEALLRARTRRALQPHEISSAIESGVCMHKSHSWSNALS